MNVPSDVLLPVSQSPTLPEVIDAAVDRADDRAVESDTRVTLHLIRVLPHVRDDVDVATDRQLNRAAERARETATSSVSVTTALVAPDRYLADPTDHAEEIRRYVDEHGIGLVVLDPNYAIDATDPDLHSIGAALEDEGVRYERPAVAVDRRLPSRAELVRFGGVFLLSFGFYLAVAGERYLYATVTGALTALVVAGLLRNVVFETTPRPARAVLVVIRGIAYVPYLLWEILKANVVIAYVVLHPSLPLETYLDRIDTPLSGGLPVTGFANSLTLTPGTLTIDADGNDLVVHSMTAGTRRDLLDGNRERAVQYVFEGRSAFDLPGPIERQAVVELVGSVPIDPATEPEGVPTSEPDTGTQVTEESDTGAQTTEGPEDE
ncbi:multicomponent Na+:H+ antiporter subunit E [Halalkaliarchaeum desulfuricum]|uniref:Multicomponent Na+:H+ antiporter subunit E n=1 Tax=Halalkaliarchaeum desulfuricum TaxID=2055893 RepID=A0A343TIH9_9EURY|nr:monovalent cation/H+ antiporter subunit E [Halalkaliarchaeum desulfuricum]AUX08901.1 multicomponent Na+:H+ antiporter subunit E [Halalkaliarchaeum desulfuricum]